LAHFTYIGDEPGTDAFGLLFPAGVAVEVTNPHAINKLRGNPFFAESFDGVEVVEALPQPKRRGRPPKAQ
jgi:hypothetical protein